jgi:hypothetical protein
MSNARTLSVLIKSITATVIYYTLAHANKKEVLSYIRPIDCKFDSSTIECGRCYLVSTTTRYDFQSKRERYYWVHALEIKKEPKRPTFPTRLADNNFDSLFE